MASEFSKGVSSRINLAVETGSQVYTTTQAPIQSFEIIHPVYGYNMVENLKK
jgi:hypothetical protein